MDEGEDDRSRRGSRRARGAPAALNFNAAGAPRQMFALVFGVGTVVTTFLSNDATAVVRTPAVYAAASKARAKPLPLLFACALIANAASFVLPISNPANLVLYGGTTPPLGSWMASFALPSLLSIGATFVLLKWIEREAWTDRASMIWRHPPWPALRGSQSLGSPRQRCCYS